MNYYLFKYNNHRFYKNVNWLIARFRSIADLNPNNANISSIKNQSKNLFQAR